MDRPLQACTEPGCPARVLRGRCEAHTLPARQEGDRDNVAVRRWYRTARWMRLRLAVLVDAAYQCQGCGAVQVALEVDHIVRHRGDPDRFWDRTNLQALCSTCHAHKTNRGE
jgi:5-methylcytosine-specific restriction endonuclease McrA